MMQVAKYSLFALLTIHLVWRGLIPALTSLDTDFPNYYVAARLALEGRFERSYDDVWFQEQICALGIKEMGKLSPYPPVTAFVMMPLASFEPLNALRAWTIFNCGVLICSIALLSKMLDKDWLWTSIVFLLSGHALVNNFRFGQFYLVLTFLTICSLYLWQRSRKVSSGALMGIGAALKYFPIVILPLCIVRKEWRIVFAFLGTVITILVLSIAALGVEPHRQFIESVLLPHLSGNIQNRFSMTLQSWNSLLARLTLFDSTLNPNPFFNSPIGYSVGLVVIYASVLVSLLFGLKRAAQVWGDRALRVEFALLCVGGIVLFPASATYHFLLLSIPVAIFLALGRERWILEQKILVTLYASIGFIPYSLLTGFDGKGLLTLLAYPRLFLTTLILAIAIILVVRFKPNQFDYHPQVHIV